MTSQELGLARCQNTDPESFFPNPSDLDGQRAALAVCRACPVRARCLDVAVESRYTGVWGGTTDAQRDLIRRRAAS